MRNLWRTRDTRSSSITAHNLILRTAVASCNQTMQMDIQGKAIHLWAIRSFMNLLTTPVVTLTSPSPWSARPLRNQEYDTYSLRLSIIKKSSPRLRNRNKKVVKWLEFTLSAQVQKKNKRKISVLEHSNDLMLSLHLKRFNQGPNSMRHPCISNAWTKRTFWTSLPNSRSNLRKSRKERQPLASS